MFDKKTLVLALAGMIAAPMALADNEMLMQELRRLADRVAQLEAANQKLEAWPETRRPRRSKRVWTTSRTPSWRSAVRRSRSSRWTASVPAPRW